MSDTAHCQPQQRESVRAAADALDDLRRVAGTTVYPPRVGPYDRWALAVRLEPRVCGIPAPVLEALAAEGLRIRTVIGPTLAATP